MYTVVCVKTEAKEIGTLPIVLDIGLSLNAESIKLLLLTKFLSIDLKTFAYIYYAYVLCL